MRTDSLDQHIILRMMHFNRFMDILKVELRECTAEGFSERFDLKGEAEDNSKVFFYLFAGKAETQIERWS